MIKHLTWKEFVKEYNPIKNVIEEDPACDGHLFTNFDDVKSNFKNNIWSLVDDNVDDLYITNKIRYVNALGYLVTKIEYSDDVDIEVRLHESDLEQ